MEGFMTFDQSQARKMGTLLFWIQQSLQFPDIFQLRGLFVKIEKHFKYNTFQQEKIVYKGDSKIA